MACGWLGWSAEDALDTDMSSIEIAYKGRIAMLKACFGSADDKPKAQKPTANDILSFARAHNRIRRERGL